MTDIITSGVLDGLAKEQTAFHELSMSRLGYYGNEGLYRMIFEELKARGLARDSEDRVSIPMHPMVRSLVLVLLSQIVRAYGAKIGAGLSPVTDSGKLVAALSELLSIKREPSAGSVVEFDLNAVTVDVGSVPLDELLDFRAQNLEGHKRYSLSARKFAMELSRMSEEERKNAFDLRQAELNDIANDLRKRGREAWRKPASFALTLVGAAVSIVSPAIGAAISVGAAAAGYKKETKESDTGAYTYLFNAGRRFAYY